MAVNAHPRDTIRTFICIEVPESIQQRLAGLQSGLRKAGAKISWVKPSNIHLTIKFLGDVRASRIPSIIDAVKRAASRGSEGLPVAPFHIEVGGAGCFPSARSPRVLWVGLTSIPEPLLQIHTAIDVELSPQGFPSEQRKFSPHLTIGRVREPRGAGALGELLTSRGFAPGSFLAKEVVVMRSDLHPTGSVYTHQAVIALPEPADLPPAS